MQVWTRIWLPRIHVMLSGLRRDKMAVRVGQGSGSAMGRDHYHLGTLASGIFRSMQEPGRSMHTCLGWAAGSVTDCVPKAV